MIEAGNRPDGEQFAEGSASDQAFTVGNPVDFAGNIKALVDQERERQGGHFNAAWFLRKEMRLLYHATG
ncbi:MAG TPA: hypothetical protein VEP90_07545, partial [Methylomirabilota bacterium]|nr:hypothetical protein [Methylomirabilota bacterium]